MKRSTLFKWHWLCAGLALLMISGCKAAQSETTPPMQKVSMTVGDQRFTVTLADTEAARAFAGRLPLTLEMADLHRNEKYADLAQSLPTHTIRPGTIQTGDVMLYGNRTLVVFYLTFHSSYAYTRIGRIDQPENLAKTLGSGTARIHFAPNTATGNQTP